MITLQIKRKYFDAIAKGTKKIEWRAPSKYNKRLLLKKNEEGLYCKNEIDKEIQLINGRSNNSPRMIIQVSRIEPLKFIRDIDEPENFFKAPIGATSIGIFIEKVLSVENYSLE